MLPGMLKGERVASLSEAQAQSQDSYLKIRERFAKVRERSAKGCVGRASPHPALQAMGDDIASAIGCWSLALG